MTRILPTLAMCLVCFCLAGCNKPAPPDPHKILDKAIKAHGGEESIRKDRMGTMTGRDTGEGLDMTWEESFHLPNRWRRATHGVLDGKQVSKILIVGDGKLFFGMSDGREERRATIPLDQLKHNFGMLYALVNIRKNGASLSYLGEAAVRGSPVLGIRAEHDGQHIDLFFGKQDGLLAKASSEMKGPGGRPALVTTIFWDYEPVDGIQLARRCSVAFGERDAFVVVSHITDVRILNKVDEALFRVP